MLVHVWNGATNYYYENWGRIYEVNAWHIIPSYVLKALLQIFGLLIEEANEKGLALSTTKCDVFLGNECSYYSRDKCVFYWKINEINEHKLWKTVKNTLFISSHSIF